MSRGCQRQAARIPGKLIQDQSRNNHRDFHLFLAMVGASGAQGLRVAGSLHERGNRVFNVPRTPLSLFPSKPTPACEYIRALAACEYLAGERVHKGILTIRGYSNENAF